MNKKQALKAVRNADVVYVMGAWTSIMMKVSKKDARELVEKLFEYTGEEFLDYSRVSVPEGSTSLFLTI